MLPAAAVLVCALDLLGRSSAAAPIRFLDKPPLEASQHVEAFVEHEPPVIYLITSTETFRRAQHSRPGWSGRDACRKIASIIVHEEWHLRHGRDEQGAYFAQLTTLAALHAEPMTINKVRQAMMEAVARQKRLERRESMSARADGPTGPTISQSTR